MEKFVSYVRSLRLPVTRSLMQERARIVATSRGITEFKAGNGYIQRFLTRTNVKESTRLNGPGSAHIPSNHEERMAAIREIFAGYLLRNVHNMDESGLYCWIRLRC